MSLRQKNYQALIDRCKVLPPVRTAVVHPVNANVFQAVTEAAEAGLIVPVLIGPSARIALALEAAGLKPGTYEIIDAGHSHAAAARAAELAATGKVGAIMKGSLHSDEVLSAVIAPMAGLRTERRISHAFLVLTDDYPRPLFLADAAVNIAPDLSQKADILRNTLGLWSVIYGPEPARVAILAAVETVNASMQATVDAAALCKMADRGQITGGLLDGPLALDNAISEAAAQEKGIISTVAGRADILLAPDIEAGNMLAKQMIFLGGADAAGIVLGARVPVILTSRADTLRTRLLSCALAVMMADARSKGRIR